MIDQAILNGLKRVNISSDLEKTKERVESLWKPLKASEKKDFLEKTGENENNIHRIRKEGSITPKRALALASHFNYDPSYISADVDENTGWSDEALRIFLENKGYSALMAEPSAKPEGQGKGRAGKAPKATLADEYDSSTVSKLSIEEMTQLLNALSIRAPHNPDAKKKYLDIERILLS